METDERLRCLKQLLQTHTAERSGGWDTAVPGLALCRWTAPSQAQTWTYEPGIALAVQGAKRITLGDNTYCYRPGDILLTSVDIPAIAQVCEASEQAPFLALLVSFNLSDLPALMQESGFQLLTSEPAVPQAVCPVTEALLSAVCRLVALLEKPDDIPVM